ncbi:MAG: peptidoglycan bridge formation glycyltransferase FemA/FemB family protein [Candidatus Pacebacteria bacterium]|nr:peptidoglycan bridge formation glycyltransferase FemA/FemB family protein [Candidatus Paceibacterota bacterium]PIR59602.1 MAG: peptidoglycan bridge formation protein FemAB [Candidatus Pacebacteria bacterium CG10_big_fil_rev_8_21_14_0_10_45_6]
MLLRKLREEERSLYNSVVTHPLQSWEWGEFRKKTGIKIERVGLFEGGKLVRAFQVTFHQIPVINRAMGYLPKGYLPDEEQLSTLRQLAKDHGAVAIKLEPNIAQPVEAKSAHKTIIKFLEDHGAVPGKPLFTKYTFQIDLTKTEEELFNNLQSKTRYNVTLAAKKGVTIEENTTEAGLEEHLAILTETTKRQGFYAHSPEYFRTMWQELHGSGMMRIFEAKYEGKTLASWIMFVFNNVLYYPYGASRDLHRDVMASNLLLWEMIHFGKLIDCNTFDLWGSLGPEPDPKHPWFGFHRFKKGYGGTLMEFVGTYDLIVDPLWYKIYQIGDTIRWKILRLKAKIAR